MVAAASEFDQWRIGILLGKGAFGEIHEVTHKHTQRVEAVKTVISEDSKSREAAIKEAKVWKMIGQHENIVSLYKVYDGPGVLRMVMEKCDCNLWDRLQDCFCLHDLAPLMQQMLYGVSHLHSLNIVHRDIKVCNFLCVGEGFERVKLCDFGFATSIPLGKKLKATMGTPPYMSPEMLAKEYDLKTDVWSIGVCCHFMISGGRFPYEPQVHNSAGMKQAIIDGAPLSVNFEARTGVNPRAKEFTVSLLNRNVERRPTAQEALDHSFLQSCSCRRESSPAHSDRSTVASERDFQDCRRRVSTCEDVLETERSERLSTTRQGKVLISL